jgi:hypothetical protein
MALLLAMLTLWLLLIKSEALLELSLNFTSLEILGVLMVNTLVPGVMKILFGKLTTTPLKYPSQKMSMMVFSSFQWLTSMPALMLFLFLSKRITMFIQQVLYMVTTQVTPDLNSL